MYHSYTDDTANRTEFSTDVKIRRKRNTNTVKRVHTCTRFAHNTFIINGRLERHTREEDDDDDDDTRSKWNARTIVIFTFTNLRLLAGPVKHARAPAQRIGRRLLFPKC